MENCALPQICWGRMGWVPSVLCGDGAGVADPFVLGPPVKCQALGSGTAVAALVGETHVLLLFLLGLAM